MQNRSKTNKSPFKMHVLAILWTFSAISMNLNAQEQLPDEEISIPEASVISSDDHLEIKLGQIIYRIEDPKIGDNDRLAFENMPPKEKAAFNTNRRLFLSLVARGLNLMKYGFGFGSVVKEKIRFQIDKLKEQKRLAQIAALPENVRQEVMAAQEQIEAEKMNQDSATLKLAFKQRSQQIVSNFLNGIDRNLWRQAPLFSRSNEFGVMVSGGLETLGAKGNKGFGGLVDFGLSLGYNRDEKALVIQIFNGVEKYKSSVMPAFFLAGIVGKTGTYIANQRAGELHHVGTSYYPPMMPGFSSITKDNFMTGFSSGLTWPPSPIGDMLTYTDTLDQNMVLRVTVLPISKGFIRIQSSLGLHTIKAVVSTVKDVLAGMIRSPAKMECSSVFQ